METTKKSSHHNHPVVFQDKNNSTIWLGHTVADNDFFAGQTFICPSSGMLSKIQVFASMIQSPGEILLTVHEFDSEKKS